MGHLKRLVQEIHRRSLWQVLGIYLLGAWVGYEAIEALVSGLGLPEWFPAFAVVLFIIGLPIVLATAFIQKGSPAVSRADPTLLPGPELGEGPSGPRAPGAPRGFRGLFTWRNAIAGGVLAFALWGVVAAGWLFLQGTGDDGREPSRESGASIAVLPFVNMSEDEANEHFSDGVTEEIISALSQVDGLQVVSRSATFRYKGADVDPRAVGRDLGVATILEGSVRREGDEVRITAQLIDVADGFHLWSETYDRRLAAIFDIQTDVAARIADALELSLTESDRESIRQRATDNLETYESYSRGRQEFYKYTPEGNAAAIRYFERALELDPNYALAWAGLSLCKSRAYLWSGDEQRLVEAEDAARRALEIDPDLAEAHFALGFVYERRGVLAWRRDRERALRYFEREEAEMRTVLALNPNHAHAHDSLADLYRGRGLLEEALSEYQMALRLDPFLVPALSNTGGVYRHQGRFGDALRTYRQGLKAHPELERFHKGLAHVLREQGRHRAAMESCEAALAIDPKDVGAYTGLARSQIGLNDFAGARSTAERLLRSGADDASASSAYSYILGRLALVRDDAETAIARFREARAPFLARQEVVPAGYERALGEAYLAAGEPGLAAERFEAVLQDFPYVKIVHYELGRALEAAGEPARAAAEYRAFLEAWEHADPGTGAVADAKQRLAALTTSRA